MSDPDPLRDRMLDEHLARRGITDSRVLAAMREVPRERFVGEDLQAHAYADSALPIGSGQTISQPYVVAEMIQGAEVGPDDRVLEVGAGSGYAAAVLGRIARTVIAIERHEDLARQAAERIAALGIANVDIRQGDGSAGLPEEAPFDAILVAAGGPEVPPALKQQLAIGGRLVMPVGGAHGQDLRKLVRRSETRYEEESLGQVRFVPLIGEQGWREDDR
jgi:protein-L-isoaspartate(D-aspartate) O-methyltransferase